MQEDGRLREVNVSRVVIDDSDEVFDMYAWMFDENDITEQLGVMEPDTGYHEMNDVFERIADLIDRPTRLDLVEHKQDPFIPGKRMVDGCFHCSDCGWDGQIWEHIGFGDMLAYEAVHCPKCGAGIERRA